MSLRNSSVCQQVSSDSGRHHLQPRNNLTGDIKNGLGFKKQVLYNSTRGHETEAMDVNKIAFNKCTKTRSIVPNPEYSSL